jgi:glycosyltransferase involved in cell wall biosynthesis
MSSIIPKKIGIDARFYGRAGPGRYTKNIVQHLEKVDEINKYSIFLTKEGFNLYEPQNKNFQKVLADIPWYSFKEQTLFLVRVLQEGLDLYYVPHFNIPILYPKKLVTAIPDMIMHTYSTEKGTTLPKPYFRFKKIVYKLVFWWAVFRSDKVIVPSKTVMKDFVETIKSIPESKYVLAYEGVDPDFIEMSKEVNDSYIEQVLEKYGITSPYILHVGSMYEHKNIDTIIDMYKVLKEKYKFSGKLVLVSKKDKFSERIQNRIVSEELEEDVILPAFVVESDEIIVVRDKELIALRKRAELYVMAALKEGFSLTALEGMTLGLPAILSDIDCHREVYESSVIYFNPYDPNDMAEKANKMLTDTKLREEYVKRGYEQVNKYDWIHAAKVTLGIFDDVLKRA